MHYILDEVGEKYQSIIHAKCNEDKHNYHEQDSMLSLSCTLAVLLVGDIRDVPDSQTDTSSYLTGVRCCNKSPKINRFAVFGHWLKLGIG